jgi:hypothetical protein
LFVNPFEVPDDDTPRWNKPFVRCSWQTVPHHDPAVTPRTYVVGTYGPKVPRFKEHNNNRVFSIDGLMPTMTRQGPHPLRMIFIPSSAPGARRYRAAVIRSYTCDEVRRGVGLEGAWLTNYTPGGAIPDDSWHESIGQCVAPAMSEAVVQVLAQLRDSTRSAAVQHVTPHLHFNPECRADIINPLFDTLVARFHGWALARDSAWLRGCDPARPKLTRAIMGEGFRGHIVGSAVVIYLQPFLHQIAWGQVWRLPEGAPPSRVTAEPVQTVSLAAALARGDFRDTDMDLVAHSLRDHVNYSGSMISPMLVILSANSEAFVKDSRAADDIRAELDEKCLEEFPSARLAIVPYCTVKQNVTDKKLPAHEAAAGKQPKIRRISDKAAGSSALAACNAWVAMEKRAKLELCRLDDILDNIARPCASCAWRGTVLRFEQADPTSLVST